MRSLRINYAGVATVCASLAIAFGMWTGVRAGTLPDISGTWYANGNPAARCRISQSGNWVSLTNEGGVTATGHFVNPSKLSTDWGLMNAGRITGTISSDLRRIDWSNGTFWSRPTPAPLTPAATATPMPTPRPTPTPALRISVRVRNNDSNPIRVYGASLTNGFGSSYLQCVSFRNITTKVVTDVDFDFVVTNGNGGVEANYGWTDKGTFTPPVNIDNHCFSGRIWAPRVVRRMTNESVRVMQVTFADGSSWKPGAHFLRGYSASGQRLPQPIAETPQSGGPSDETVAGIAPRTYRLRSEFTGPEKCLDIVNDGNNNRLTMAACGDYSGQKWTIEPDETAGYWRLQTLFTGSGACLDIVNNGANNRLTMATCGDYSGQRWTIEPIGETGYARLRTAFTGRRKCLDIVNDGSDNRPIMDACGDVSGQKWKISGPRSPGAAW